MESAADDLKLAQAIYEVMRRINPGAAVIGAPEVGGKTLIDGEFDLPKVIRRAKFNIHVSGASDRPHQPE